MKAKTFDEIQSNNPIVRLKELAERAEQDKTKDNKSKRNDSKDLQRNR